MIKLTDNAVFLIAIEAEASEDDVRRVLDGRYVPPHLHGRVLAAIANAGHDLAQLPRPAAPLLCADQPERVTNLRLGRGDHGPNIFSSRRDRR